jgi:hypothetical protein
MAYVIHVEIFTVTGSTAFDATNGPLAVLACSMKTVSVIAWLKGPKLQAGNLLTSCFKATLSPVPTSVEDARTRPVESLMLKLARW